MSQFEATKKANDLLKKSNFVEARKIQQRMEKKSRVVNMIELQCPVSNQCDIFDSKGNILYLDDAHFSVEGFNVIRDRMLKAYPGLLP